MEATEAFIAALPSLAGLRAARDEAKTNYNLISESRPQGSDSLLTPMGYRSFLQIPPPL